MTFKPRIWFPISIVLSLLNLAAVGFAARTAEPWHATTHAALALAFGLWAVHLRTRLLGGAARPDGGELESRVEALEGEMGNLVQQLTETQERLDFAERLLAQSPETRRVGPELR
jgi:hypothetical protein